MGTLSAVAEQFHISQPTITRAMKCIEEEFGAVLFERTKNSIKLGETGLLAAEEATMVVKQTDSMLRRVRAFDRASHTIAIGSSAAVQTTARKLRKRAHHRPIGACDLLFGL